MIATLLNADWGRWKAAPVSRQKKDALFELACRMALIAEAVRADDGSGRKRANSLAAAAKAERRKTLAFGLDILAEGGDAESLDQAFDLDPVFRDLDAGTRLELGMVRKGLLSMIAREHPFINLRRTTAFLGPEYYEKAGAWMLERIKRRKRKSQPLLVPGEMPDVVRSLASESGGHERGLGLERAMRAGGRSLASAALAGCPQESIDLAAPVFGSLGGAILADDALWLRGRLSSEEISQAQSAFTDIVQGLSDGGELALNGEEELYGDPDFIAEITRVVLGMDEKPLKTFLRNVEARLLAMAMQGMEPEAHERILGLLTKKEQRNVLDALDAMILLPRREIEDAGRAFARGLITAIERLLPTASSSDSMEKLTQIRDWQRAETAG